MMSDKDAHGLGMGYGVAGAYGVSGAWGGEPGPERRRLMLIDDKLEQRLLGTLLALGAQLPAARLPEGLLASHFADPVHRAVYEAMARCRAGDTPFDLASVATDLRDKPDLDEVGGTAYLAQLVSIAEAGCVEVATAADTIAELAHARELLAHLNDVSGLVRAHDKAVRDPIDLGSGRTRAQLLAMDLLELARRVLDRSAGWA